VKIGVWPKGTGLVEVRAIDPTEPGSDRGAPYVNTAPKPAPITAPPPPARVVATAPAGARTSSTPERAVTRPPSSAIAAPVGTAAASGAVLVEAGTRSPQSPTARVGASPAGETSSPQSPTDDDHVPGMTGISPTEALPPLAGAGTGAAAANRPAAPATGAITAPTAGKPSIYLQVGAFSDAVNANRVADKLNQAGLGPVSVVEATIGGRSVRRVRVGPLADVDTADRVTDQIAGMGLPRPSVAVD